MKMHAIRITEGQDLRRAIADFVAKNNLSASAIISAVGSLKKARLRMAGAQNTDDGIRDFDGPFEIVSLMGIPQSTMKEGCIVHTTVELVLASDDRLTFTREVDPATGFDELVIREG